jgi:hypothetical protein
MCTVALLDGILAGVPRAQDATPGRAGTTAATPAASAAGWREAPRYLALFVPRIYRDAYRSFVSPLGIDAVLRAVAADEHTRHAPGAWTARPESPTDAFGSGGTYDRFTLARLFGSRRPLVARGPQGRNGHVDESWTLVSPYPSPDLSRLEPGTLLIILRVP